MSRTYRRTPSSFLRYPQTTRLKRQTGLINDMADEARQFGIELSAPAYSRNHKAIIDAWEDIAPSALYEIYNPSLLGS